MSPCFTDVTGSAGADALGRYPRLCMQCIPLPCVAPLYSLPTRSREPWSGSCLLLEGTGLHADPKAAAWPAHPAQCWGSGAFHPSAQLLAQPTTQLSYWYSSSDPIWHKRGSASPHTHVPASGSAWPRGLSWHGLACGTGRGTSVQRGGRRSPSPPRCALSISHLTVAPLLSLLPGKWVGARQRMLQSLALHRMGETRNPAQCWCALLRAKGALLCRN